jgi:hypothetical protein
MGWVEKWTKSRIGKNIPNLRLHSKRLLRNYVAQMGSNRMNELLSRALPRQWLAGQWLVDGALDPLLAINAQCLELLCSMASRTVPTQAKLLSSQSRVWQTLSAPARELVAASPYLLVDAGFGDVDSWDAFASRAVRDVRRELIAPAFEGEGAHNFVRSVLVYGWHLARSHRQLARIILGMTPACASRIAALSLSDLDWLAERQPGCVRPRWERHPLVWRHLLLAAQEQNDKLLTQVSLRGIQLLAAGVLSDPRREVPVTV